MSLRLCGCCGSSRLIQHWTLSPGRVLPCQYMFPTNLVIHFPLYSALSSPTFLRATLHPGSCPYMFARFSNLLCKPFSCKAETLFFHLGYAEAWLYTIGNEGIDCEEDKHYFARHLAQVRLLQERDDCSPLVKRKGRLPFIGSSWCWGFKILRLIHPNVLIMDPWVLLSSYSWLWHRKLSRLYIVSFVVLSHLSLSN